MSCAERRWGRRIVAAPARFFIGSTVEERPMRMCLKCSKKVSDDSKICRDCGAILEDVPDDSMPETDGEWKPSSQLGSPFAAKPQETGQEEGDEQFVGEVVAESDEPAWSDSEASAWKCPQCGEMVPGTFDVCWKCLATKDGEKAEESEPVFFPEDPDASKPDEEPEPTELYVEPLAVEEDEEATPPQSACPQCGSAKMMFGVTVRDQGHGSCGTLQVVICGDPRALIFKLYEKLRANICGDCGHVELRVANPKELYRHYRKSSK